MAFGVLQLDSFAVPGKLRRISAIHFSDVGFLLAGLSRHRSGSSLDFRNSGFTAMPDSTVILNAAAIQRALTRIAHEIAEENETVSEVALVGIQRGGVPLAARLGGLLSAIWGQPVPKGDLDVSMHREVLDRRPAA